MSYNAFFQKIYNMTWIPHQVNLMLASNLKCYKNHIVAQQLFHHLMIPF